MERLNKPSETGEYLRERASKNSKRCPAKLTRKKINFSRTEKKPPKEKSESTKKKPTHPKPSTD